ncbi:hypothetical protein TTRE_0000005101 [Trichuris trichiura]|uniref:Uncharacterized protein n=1 Tax=Trichuris trichiura TaxID=36087 RepID=A0A077YUN2_TRITR|nr:hypothetical protein TTRE_0000005101 [Trichuris trichiura]
MPFCLKEARNEHIGRDVMKQIEGVRLPANIMSYVALEDRMARQEDSSLSSPPSSRITSHLVTFPCYKPSNYLCELHLPQCVDREGGVEPRMTNVCCDKQAASCTHSHFASCHGHDDANNLLPFCTESYSEANDAMPSIVCIDKQENTLLPSDCLTTTTDKRTFDGDSVDSAKRDHGGSTSVRRLPAKGAPDWKDGERRMAMDRSWVVDTSFQQGEAKSLSCAIQQIVGSRHRAQSLPNLCQHHVSTNKVAGLFSEAVPGRYLSDLECLGENARGRMQA